MSRPIPMRNWKLEKWNRFSIVFPPTGIVSPALRHTDAVTEHDRVERAAAGPCLEQSGRHVSRVPELVDALAAGVEEVDAVHGVEPRPGEARRQRDLLLR